MSMDDIDTTAPLQFAEVQFREQERMSKFFTSSGTLSEVFPDESYGTTLPIFKNNLADVIQSATSNFYGVNTSLLTATGWSI
jgi:hypothetical protein